MFHFCIPIPFIPLPYVQHLKIQAFADLLHSWLLLRAIGDCILYILLIACICDLTDEAMIRFLMLISTC